MMKCYKLDPEAFPRNKVMISTLILFLVIAPVTIFTVDCINGNKIDGSIIMLQMLIFLVIILGSIRKNVKMGRDRWLFYELEITDNIIVNRQYHIDDIVINKNEICGIIVDEKGTLFIKTSDKNKFIKIPINLLGYEEVKELLSQGISIELKKDRWYKGYLLHLLNILIGLVFFCILASDNKYIVLPIGVIFSIVFVWDCVRIQRSKYIEKGFKGRKQTLLRLMVLIPVLVKISKVIG